MKHFVELCRTLSPVVLLLCGLNVSAETVPSFVVKNCKIDNAWSLPGHPEIMEKTWQEVCIAIDLPPTDVPGGGVVC